MEGKIYMTHAQLIQQLGYKANGSKLVPNKKALGIIEEIMGSLVITDIPLVIEILRKYDFRTDRLVKFYTQTCNNDEILFNQTINILNSKLYTKEEIDKNMELPIALPLLDESAGSYVNPRGDLWQGYCEAQHESFIKKVADRVKKKED